jgi:predicted TIM-barrel fold metal-dependent hydrolase
LQDRITSGISLEQMIDEMDEAGVDFALLSSGPAVPLAPVLAALDRWPERFAAVVWCDPTDQLMAAVRQLEALVRNHNVVGFRLEPFLVWRPPTDRVFYPIYAKCIELDIALAVQVGGTMPLYPSRTGDPMHIDDIALDFPELRIVCGHLGTPWIDQMLHVAQKHEHVYIDTSARLPKYFEPQFLQFLKTYGRDKCIFASDWPILPFDRPLDQVESLGLSDEVKARFLGENAVHAFKLRL